VVVKNPIRRTVVRANGTRQPGQNFAQGTHETTMASTRLAALTITPTSPGVAEMPGGDGVDDPKAWQALAACRGLSSELFYPKDDDAITAAKAVCRACEVETQCLEHALTVREKDGIWGGSTERERRSIIRRRRRLAARERASSAEQLSSSAAQQLSAGHAVRGSHSEVGKVGSSRG
jgi:WhiB family transcriptional regulator, redox-sensing transcriptional regulator